MGNEIYYCIGCGSRVSGPDFGGDRSHCARCLGIPVDATPVPGRNSSKRIRKPSSTAITAVAVRVRPPVTAPPRRSRALVFGSLSLAGALLFALGSLFAPAREVERTVVVPPPAPPPPAPEPVAPPPPVPVAEEALPKPLEELREKPQRAAPAPTVNAELDAKADYFHDVIQEAASALADEGRFDDALARIRTFPPEYRNTRAWNSLEGLRRQIEARARSK